MLGFPERDFLRVFPGVGQEVAQAGTSVQGEFSGRGILWKGNSLKALLRRKLGCCPAGLALIVQGRGRVRAQPGECPCASAEAEPQVCSGGFLAAAAAPLPVGLTPPLVVLGWSQRLPGRTGVTESTQGITAASTSESLEGELSSCRGRESRGRAGGSWGPSR